jgi:DNA-binding LytR/AlgR family response regulator
MNILIVEDEAPAQRRLEKLIKELKPNANIVTIFDSIESTINFLMEKPNLDLVFMDIQLADGLSFEIFEEVKFFIPVIFTTAYEEYAIKAFKLNSIDYLLKPIKKENLQESFEKLNKLENQGKQESNLQIPIQELLKNLQKEQKEYKNRFLIKSADKLISLLTEEIAYFQAQDKFVFVSTKDNKKYLIDYSLDVLENILDPNFFFRLNRQFITHFESVKNITQDFNGKLKITLLGAENEMIIVSREKSNLLKNWLGGE